MPPDPSERASLSDQSVTAKIAAELRHNDGCGTGPLSDGEYMDDAAAILRIVREHGSGSQDPSMDLANVNAAYVVERDDNARLRAALERFAAAAETYVVTHGDLPAQWVLDVAREALNGGESHG